MEKYTFIHPTKSGGTAIGMYFKEHYGNYIDYEKNTTGHKTLCSNNNNPIIVVRDIKSRFTSMYKYWKNGSDYWKRPEKWKEKYIHTTIVDFINMIKKDDKQLYHISKAVDAHRVQPTTKWINDTDYKNIIVIKYEKNLNDKIQKLINLLNIPNKNIELPIVNKTLTNNIHIEENRYDNDTLKYINDFIQEYYKDDVKLINTIETRPELFKLVI